MKSMAYISTSVKAVCHFTPNSVVSIRSLAQHHTHALCRQVFSKANCLCTVHMKHRCVNSVRSFRTTCERGAVALQLDNTSTSEEKDYDDLIHQLEKYLFPTKVIKVSSTDSQRSTSVTAENTEMRSLQNTLKVVNESEILRELGARMSHAPTSISIAGFATVLGLCADIGMHPQNPVLTQLKDSCIDKLSEEQVGVSHLCLLGEVACNLEGNSELLDRVLNSLWWKVNRDLTAVEASQMYIFLAHISDPSLCQDLLTKLNRQTETLALRLPASSVCDILHALAVLRQGKAFSLILKLNRRASHLLKHFSDTELIKLLKALIYLGQCDEALFASMEKHLPKRLLTADPELTSSLMEYCLYTRCRSEPIFEAVAESFVLNSESYSTSQIARQVVAMGRLNYLPGCAREMFKKLESVLSSRFAQFPPRALVDILHSCIHLERFPLNFMAKVFSPYFLQRLEVTQGECLDKNALAQLTQLNMSTLLECTYYQGPRLPYYYHVKKFASGDQLFETPMDSYLYRQIKGPLCKLLGGKDKFSTRAFTHNGYTIDVEISMDENGYVLPLTQWDQTHRRTALCLDGQDRFCTNTNHLLGKEATKRRHLHRLGYDVVQIPYYEFEKLETAEERMKYLQKKIFPTIFRFYR